MKSYLSLALKEIKAQKITAILVLIAVILSSVMTTAIGQSLGILQGMRVEQASSLNGDRYATFHQLSKKQASELSADPRLVDVGSLINLGSAKLGNSGLSLFLREYLDGALAAYPSINKVKAGRLPTAPNEIALPESVLQYLPEDIQVGGQVTLDVSISLLYDTEESYKYTATFDVCGILESIYIGYATGSVEAIAGAGTASMYLPDRYMLYSTDFKTRSTKQFKAIVDDLARALNMEDRSIQYNWVLLDALGVSYAESGASDTDTGFSFMTIACVMVGALVLLAAGLVIYNVLKIAVTKRIREYGTLRAIGSERKQIYRLVSLELLILCGVGIPIGLLSGVLSAKGILIAATSVLNPDLFMADTTAELHNSISGASVSNGGFLLVSVVITLLFAMLAAYPAARYAAHVSPTVAMSGQSAKIKRRVRREKKIRNFESYYARLNLMRGRGRTAITILSLVMSITVFVALQSFTAILDTSSSVKEIHLGDYAITNETVGIPPQSVNQLREQDQLASLATTKLSVYVQDEDGRLPLELNVPLQAWESMQIAGLDDERLTSYVKDLSEQDIQDLLSGSACIVKNPIAFSYEGQTVESTNFEIGDTLSVNGVDFQVVGVADQPVTINNGGFINGVQIIVCDTAYDNLTGHSQYSEVYPTLRENSDTGQFETWLNRWCDKNPGSHWLSYLQSDAQLEESFGQIKMLCWGLILFIGLIGVLNIINTVYSNIHTRVSEIGMQRAIGMSTRSLYKTFLWEGAYYGIFAAVIGGPLGYICTVFVSAATTDTLQFVAIPYFSIIEAAAFSIAACLLATAVPLRSIARLNIVESIEAVE